MIIYSFILIVKINSYALDLFPNTKRLAKYLCNVSDFYAPIMKEINAWLENENAFSATYF